MRSLILFCSIILFLSCSSRKKEQQSTSIQKAKPVPQIATISDQFIKHYQGTINKEYVVDMVLYNAADGNVYGEYWYKKIGKRIQLVGEINLNEELKLSEIIDDKEHAFFKTQFDNPAQMKGTWETIDGKKKYPFELKEVSFNDPHNWTKNWHLNGVWNVGTLVVGAVTDKWFYFNLEVVTNAHIATAFGRANLQSDKAIYKEQMKYSDAFCQLAFQHHDNYIEIDQQTSTGDCGFGMRAYVSGKYEDENKDIKADLANYGVDDIFKTKAKHDSFQQLVGTAYETFAFNMQSFEKTEINNPQQKIFATAYKGFAIGMLQSNEAIIVHDKEGNIWAATIDYLKENDKWIIRYFSNTEQWKTKIPKVISEWGNAFPDYELVFNS